MLGSRQPFLRRIPLSRKLAFDFETYAIVPGVQHPPAVCMSYSFIDGDKESGVVDWREGIALLRKALVHDWCLVGANTAFDVLVAVYNDLDPLDLFSKFSVAYDNNRITDVLLRQKLLDSAYDVFRPKTNLGVVSELYGMPLSKDCDWRLRFGELDGLPISEYPADAYKYALEDSVGTANAWLGQENERFGSPHFKGEDALRSEHFQARAALALKDLESYGLRAHPVTVARFRGYNETKRDALREQLEAAGIVERVYKRDLEAWQKAADPPLPLTKSGRPSTAQAALRASGLERCINWKDNAESLHNEGLLGRSFKVNTKAVMDRVVAGFEAQNLKPPMTEPAKKKRSESVEEYIVRRQAFKPKVKTDLDACEKSKDLVLAKFGEYSSVVNLLGSSTDLLERAAREPFHAYYNPMLKTGRTATGTDDETDKSGNVQNERRAPGVRECRVPRPGNVFIEADYEMLELYTFGQICLDLFGWSNLAKSLNEGKDVHTEVAADILGITYEEAMDLKKRKALGDTRTAGKAVNFGCKGKMGERTFAKAAWNNYRVDVSKIEGGAKRLIALHESRTAEFKLYSAYMLAHARDLTDRNTRYDLRLPYTGMLVAGIGYTDVHNYPFQHLASCVAKEALWLVCKARWGASPLGKQDPLFGCGVVLFVHDSITLEAAECRYQEAGARLEELMYRASKSITPLCASEAKACAQRQLSKKAEPIVDDNGKLIGIWDIWEDARKALEEKPTNLDVRTYLVNKEYPPFVVDDIAKEPG